jgi:hypothetical protein
LEPAAFEGSRFASAANREADPVSHIRSEQNEGGEMWIEYVRDGLKKGQQVFRRSVVENLLVEFEQRLAAQGDTAEVAGLKRELSIVKKQYRDLNIRLHQIKAITEHKEQDGQAVT